MRNFIFATVLMLQFGPKAYASCSKDFKQVCKQEIERLLNVSLQPKNLRLATQSFYNQETEYGLVECIYFVNKPKESLGMVKIDHESCQVVGHLIYQ